jgi:hypothetical protein
MIVVAVVDAKRDHDHKGDSTFELVHRYGAGNESFRMRGTRRRAGFSCDRPAEEHKERQGARHNQSHWPHALSHETQTSVTHPRASSVHRNLLFHFV